MKRAYKVVDVVTTTSLQGNPVAMVLDAEELATDQMQAVATWTNLSETTFLLPPEDASADYRLRISPHAANSPSRAIRRLGQRVESSGLHRRQLGRKRE